MISLWSDKTALPQFHSLSGDLKTDVLIVGGGIAGLMCARLLHDEGIDCTVVEKDRICSGVTENTTAKITAQHGLIYSKLIKTLGREKAEMYLAANSEAIEKIAELAADIDCDFERTSAYLYSEDSASLLEEEARAIQSVGGSAEVIACEELPFKTEGAVLMENQALFDPLKFLCGIADSLKIYENTDVKAIKGNTAYTSSGQIKARSIIVTTHFPFINTKGLYSLKMYQQRSYVTAVSGNFTLHGMYTSAKNGGISLRKAENLLLIGGAGGRTGTPCGGWESLRMFRVQNYPGCEEQYNWAAQDCMTLDGVPYVGHYSAHTPDLYVATGFNKWGMTSSVAAATVLRDMLVFGHSEFEPLFTPRRSIMHRQLLINGAHYISSLLTPLPPRCPHLGCKLKYNSAEHSWDCPCHGSRFSEDGKLLDNPATADKKFKKGK